jgi:cellobiose phosphorylase
VKSRTPRTALARYGRFDDARKEYVITDPRTPVKWINYVGTRAFGGLVDHTGGALICRDDPALNRITRYLALEPSGYFKGTTLYLRVRRENGYGVISPFFVPSLQPYDLFECHVGLGYTRIVSEYSGLRTEAVFFVPRGEHRLIIDIRVKNLGKKKADVDAIPVVEYSHFDALKQLTNADWVPQTMQSTLYEAEGGRKVLSQYAFMNRDTQVNFLASSLPASSFETDRKRFLGANEYGTWANPLSLQEDELGNYEARRGDNIAALLHHLGELASGVEKRLIVQLGQAESVEKALPGIRAFWRESAVDEALADISLFWEGYLSRQSFSTPDPDTDRMLNIHNPRQCYITMNWSRYLSLYQLGYGERGIGFRDSSQDVMGVLASAPGEAKELIRALLGVQKRSGAAYHQFNPLSGEASVGDAREREDRPQYYSDDHLWIVLAVSAYLKETGDFAFLEERIPFYEKDKAGRTLETATVMDHMRRALDFTQGNVGKHGLPLLGFADWNDTVNLATGAESIFTACLYGKAALEMIELADFMRDPASASALRARHAEMKDRFNQHAWDGEWYVRYFDWDGSPLGSRTNQKGKIYINAQSWPIICGFASEERARTALESVARLLNTSKGIKLSAPSFNGFDRAKGGITTFPPGTKENCGIFLHTNPWVMIAETIVGNGDRAYQYYRQINPAAKNEIIDEYECEPYVYPQNILADEHPQFGLARNSWLSGTASWVYQAATKHILGLMPTYQGLKLDPCIPSAWAGFRAVREFRGAVYQIEVKNPSHVCRGLSSLTIDGKRADGNTIDAFRDGKRHVVEAVLG